jgi:hypothetical protein
MGEPATSARSARIDQEMPESGAIPSQRSTTRRRSSSLKARHSRLRLLFFGLSSLWGFLMGVAALLCCMKQSGSQIAVGPPLFGFLLGAGLVAVVGGLLAAMVYKDAVKRGAR